MEENQIPFSLIGLANNLSRNRDCVDRFLDNLRDDDQLNEFAPEVVFAIGWSSGTILEASLRIQGLIKECYPRSFQKIPSPDPDYQNPEQSLIELKEYLTKLIKEIKQLAQDDIKEIEISIKDAALKAWLTSSA